MALLRYISHPNVHIDPNVEVPKWHLSDQGRRRATAMLDQPWVGDITRVISSDETKARETASLLAGHLGLDIEVRPATREVDRSATGFVAGEVHAALAARLFAEPDRSADGWETAAHAQRRMVDALADLLADDAGDIAVVGHGGVGTLVLCHLAGDAIDQRHDQPGQGHYWTYDRSSAAVVHRWVPIDGPS